MFKLKSALGRLEKEAVFEQVAEELSAGHRRNGLWFQALADSAGHEDKAKSLYVKYRAQSIIDEKTIVEEAKKTAQREAETYAFHSAQRKAEFLSKVRHDQKQAELKATRK